MTRSPRALPRWAGWRCATAIRAGSWPRSPTPSARRCRAAGGAGGRRRRPETHLVAGPAGSPRPSWPPRRAASRGRSRRTRCGSVRRRARRAGRRPAARRAGVQDEGSQLCALALAELPLTGPDERGWTCAPGPAARPRCWRRWRPAGAPGSPRQELHPHRAELVRPGRRGRDVEILVADRASASPMTAASTGCCWTPLHRPGRAAPAARGALAAQSGGPAGAAVAAGRPAGHRVAAGAPRWPHRLRHLLAAPGGDPASIERLLAENSRVELVDARPAFPRVPGADGSAMVQLWPHRHGTDAMFFAAAAPHQLRIG